MLGLMQDFSVAIPRPLSHPGKLNSHVAIKALPPAGAGERQSSQLREQFEDAAPAGA